MGVYAIKSEKPIVTTKPLVRNTVNQDYMNWVNYMNTHDFTFKIDEDNNLKVKVIKKWTATLYCVTVFSPARTLEKTS